MIKEYCLLRLSKRYYKNNKLISRMRNLKKMISNERRKK